MRKTVVALAVMWLCLFVFRIGVFAGDIAWQEIGRENRNLKTVLIDPGNPKIIYLGTNNSVLKTEDGGKSWKNTLSIKGQNKSVNFLLFGPSDSNSIYAATGNGLFYSVNCGKSWNRIFKGKNYFENECTAFVVLPLGIYLGTKKGFFVSNDLGRSWHKETGKLSNSHIITIASSFKEPDGIYVACVDGIFKSKDKGSSWEKIFNARPAEVDSDNEEKIEGQDEEGRLSDIRYFTLEENNPSHLYAATSRGVYRSQDRGLSWDLLSGAGLIQRDVKFLLISGESQLYAANKSGIFKYDNAHWQELSLGLMAAEVSFLALDSQNNLYAASDKGLFKTENFHIPDKEKHDALDLYSRNEPKIGEIQKAAVRYAQVDPEKIKEWRRLAAKRALLPSLSIGMDRDHNRTVSSSIWGIYGNGSTPGRYYIGPDDQTRYRNNNLSVSLTWELGDLIYSDAQTSIDVRSRLNTQLRGDILDEVTKLYFERLRVKMELDNLSIEDRKKRFEKELKLQELAALLDGLTGGYFSQLLTQD
jgi:hypothetical protein